MSLWVDKYRPDSLQALTFHEDLTKQLKQMTLTSNFPHILTYGPSGSGKKTRIASILKELYGPGVEKLKIEPKQFTTPSNKKIELQIISSNYHIEITPRFRCLISDIGIYDRIVIQDLIKELAQTKQVDTQSKHQFKIVVINEADTLTKSAQSALRRTMEKYMKNMRVILCCNVTSKIIAPIRSRCFMLRVPAPSVDQMSRVLLDTASCESIKLPQELAKRISVACQGNLRKALLMLEAMYVQQYPFSENQTLPLTDWEQFITGMANDILRSQTPETLQMTRSKLYQLLANCIPSNVIMKRLTFDLISNVDSDIKAEIIKCAAEYEHRMRQGNKAIFHLEAFVAKVMSTYSQFLMDLGA